MMFRFRDVSMIAVGLSHPPRRGYDTPCRYPSAPQRARSSIRSSHTSCCEPLRVTAVMLWCSGLLACPGPAGIPVAYRRLVAVKMIKVDERTQARLVELAAVRGITIGSWTGNSPLDGGRDGPPRERSHG